jgi:hypothetical protein
VRSWFDYMVVAPPCVRLSGAFLNYQQRRKVNKVSNFQHFFGTAGPVCAVKFDETPQIVSDASAGRAHLSARSAAEKESRASGELIERKNHSSRASQPSAQPSNIKYERAEMCPLMNLLRPNNQLFKSVFVEDIKTNSVPAESVLFRPRSAFYSFKKPFFQEHSSPRSILRLAAHTGHKRIRIYIIKVKHFAR